MAAFFAVVNNRNRKAPADADTTESKPIALPEQKDAVFDHELGMLMLNG